MRKAFFSVILVAAAFAAPALAADPIRAYAACLTGRGYSVK